MLKRIEIEVTALSYAMYLSEDFGAEKVITTIEEITKVKIINNENFCLASDHFILISIEKFTKGDFPVGVFASWPRQMELSLSEEVLARHISEALNVKVAISVPDSDPEAINPYCWWLIQPGKMTEKAFEREKFYEGKSGLVFRTSE